MGLGKRRSPRGQKLSHFALGGEMDGRLVGLKQAEAGAVGRAIDDGGVGVVRLELGTGGFDGVFARSLEFVFPSGDPGVGKPVAEMREDFRCGFEHEMELGKVAGDFAGANIGAVGSAHGGDGIIGERGGWWRQPGFARRRVRRRRWAGAAR